MLSIPNSSRGIPAPTKGFPVPTPRRSTSLAAGCIALVALAACGADKGTTATGAPGPSSATGATVPAGSAAGATAPGRSAGGASTQLAVAMKEWELTPSASSVPAGQVTVTARNNGEKVHEVALIRTDLPPDKLPLDEEGAVDERGAGVELIEEVEDVDPGTAKSFTAEVTPGNYLLVCNLVDHGEKHFSFKMYAPLTVTG